MLGKLRINEEIGIFVSFVFFVAYSFVFFVAKSFVAFTAATCSAAPVQIG